MTATVVDDQRLRGRPIAPQGLLEQLRFLNTQTRQLRKLPPKALRGALQADPRAQARPGALMVEVAALERTIQQLRQQLETALGESPAGEDEGPDVLASMIGNGALLAPADFADRLGWSRQALSKALAANRVFFVEKGGQRYYPAFYTDMQYERRQLEAVTKLLGDLPGGAKLQFFLNPRGSLGRVTPLQALARGRLPAVKAAAEGFAQG